MSFSSRMHPMQLQIVAEPRGADLVIGIVGSLAAGDAPEAQRQLLGLSASCTGRIVLDCTKLTYISSAGLRALLALHRNASGRTRGIVLAGLSEPVRQILEVAGLLPHFAIAPSVESALA